MIRMVVGISGFESRPSFCKPDRLNTVHPLSSGSRLIRFTLSSLFATLEDVRA